MRRIGVLAGLALLTMAAHASAATLYTQSNILRGPEGAVECGGASHGKCTISEVAGAIGTHPLTSDNVKVNCKANGLPANRSFEVFWVCTTAARGCHSQACGFISLGTFVSTATGKGGLSRTLGNNPFAGRYVHIDVLGAGQTYASVYAGIPIGVGPASAAVSAGDPSQQ
jgi:hypothetical protein